MAKLRIGISGWRYPPWRDKFYLKDLPQREELHHASRQFDTIELIATADCDMRSRYATKVSSIRLSYGLLRRHGMGLVVADVASK